MGKDSIVVPDSLVGASPGAGLPDSPCRSKPGENDCRGRSALGNWERAVIPGGVQVPSRIAR